MDTSFLAIIPESKCKNCKYLDCFSGCYIYFCSCHDGVINGESNYREKEASIKVLFSSEHGNGWGTMLVSTFRVFIAKKWYADTNPFVAELYRFAFIRAAKLGYVDKCYIDKCFGKQC